MEFIIADRNPMANYHPWYYSKTEGWTQNRGEAKVYFNQADAIRGKLLVNLQHPTMGRLAVYGYNL